MSPGLLSCVELEPETDARAAVIWLHGLGANGHDFEPIVPMLGIPPEAGVRFVFPHAPAIPVTINGGFVMPAWYDIRSLGLERRDDDDEGVRASAARVTELIARESERGVPAERVLLAGFSQGGAIAAHVALRHPERLLGVIALSTYLVRDDAIEAERSEANEGLPFFQAHGTQDPMVPIEGGRALRARLDALGHPVEWHEYPMMHEVCPAEVEDLGRWLRSRLPPRP